MRILVIIPAYNESENIERVVNNLIRNYPQYDYVVVNDGSKDNTAEICRRNHYNLLDLPVNLGLAGAFQTGIKYAYKKDYDAAIQLDGDGQHDPKYIKRMIECIQTTDADIVIGSRFITQKKPHNMRMFGSNIIQFAIRITTRKKVTDPTSGLRMFNRTVLKEFAVNMNYGPEPDTVSYLLRNGVKIQEVQVEMQERLLGQSYLSVARSIQYMIRMFTSIMFIQWFRRRSI